MNHTKVPISINVLLVSKVIRFEKTRKDGVRVSNKPMMEIMMINFFMVSSFQ